MEWLDGTPDYGFTSARSDHGTPSRAEIEDELRSFLSMIDPATGYIADA